VRDRRPERPLRRQLGIDVDPLVVVRRVSEEVDLTLVDRLPLARAELALGRGLELGEGQLGGYAVAPSRTRVRSAFRSIFPSGVSGSEETTWTSRGYL
jgi:hypothetical protein